MCTISYANVRKPILVHSNIYVNMTSMSSDKRNLTDIYIWGENKWGSIDPDTKRWNGIVAKVMKAYKKLFSWAIKKINFFAASLI